MWFVFVLIVGVGLVGCVFVNRFLEDLFFMVFILEVGGFEGENVFMYIFVVLLELINLK